MAYFKDKVIQWLGG